jgi:branched-chain amino acid transport system permease protein
VTATSRIRNAGASAAFLVAAVALGNALSHVKGRGTIPASFLIDAGIQGLVAALFAAGLLLVYKSARIVSFAHGSIAFSTSILAFTLLGEGWSWWAVAPLSIAAGIVAGVFVEVALLRRFVNSPRLVATVATIAAGQIVVSAVFLLPQWRFDVNFFKRIGQDELARLPLNQIHAPFAGHVRWRTAAVIFTGDHVFAVVMSALALLGLAAFLRYSRAGTAIRAIAENSQRATLLGIGTGTLGTVVWGIAGGIAALGAILSTPLSNSTLVSTTAAGTAVAASTLLQGLTAAVLGRMSDLPRTVAAAIAVTVFGRCVFWATGRTSIEDLALLIVIAAALLVQRRRLSRTDEGSASAWAAIEEIRGVPAVLRALPVVQSGRRIALTILAIVVIGYPFAMSPSQVYLGATYAIFGIVAVSLVVLAGWGGQISLGQFGLVAVGAAVGGSLTASAHVPFPVAALLASIVGAAVAVVLGLPALRIRGLYLAVTTLAFAVAMRSYVLDPQRFHFLVPGKVGRPQVGFLDFNDDRAYYFLCLGGLVLAVLIALTLRRTRTGRVLIAMRDNERAAQSFGISLTRTRLVTFAISGFLAAFAGVLLAHQAHAVRPEAFGAELSIEMFLMAVIGGLGSVSGVLTGAIYLGTTQIFIEGDVGRLLASGIGVLAVLLVYPSGLGGVVYSVRDAWLRRIALREKIYVRSLLGDVRDLTSERSRAPLTAKPEPQRHFEIDSDVRHAGASQRAKGWVYG